MITGVPWSGQFPFRKRSGEVFMAMLTKTPLYEDGELLGVIAVSSDAGVFDNTGSENMRAYQSGANGQSGVQRLNFKRIQRHPRPLVAPVPQIASSLSNLVLLMSCVNNVLFTSIFFYLLFFLEISCHLLNAYHVTVTALSLNVPGIKTWPLATGR